MPEITPIDISLDLYDNKIICINAKQEDIDSRYIRVTVTEKGKLFSLNKDTFIAQVRCRKPDGKFVHNDATITDDGKAVIKLTQQMLAVDGKCLMDLTLLQYPVNKDFDNYNMTVLSSMPFYVNVVETPIDIEDISSTNEFNTMMGCVSTMIELQVETEETLSEINETNEIILLEEQTRKNNEEVRKANEETRENKENTRIANEEIREENEYVRKRQEDSRQTKELQRQESTSQAVKECNEKITEMNEVINLFNQSVKGVINDDEISNTTTFSSEHISKLSNPNLLINGDFQVWQRGTMFSYGDYLDKIQNRYFADRWFLYCEEGFKKTFNVSYSNGYFKLSNLDGVFECSLTQKIEVNDSLKNSLSNKDVTLSFDVIETETSSHFYECSIELVVSNNTTKTITNIASKEYTTSAQKRRIQLTGSLPDLNSIEGSIEICVNLMNTSHVIVPNTVLQFANVKFEQCSFATPFISRPYSEELQMCQRYYQKCSAISPILYKYGTTEYLIYLSFKEMRIVPTLSIGWSQAYTSNGDYTGIKENEFTIMDSGDRRLIIKVTTNGEIGECYGMYVDYVLDAEMY